MSFLLVLLLAGTPAQSPPPDATATRRGLVNASAQSFGGLKTFDGGIAADLRAGSAFMGYPVCAGAPMSGQVMTFQDGQWCAVTPSAAPYVEFAPSTNAGMTLECACSQPSAVVGGALAAVTTTRTSGAWCVKANYTGVLCAANQARVMTNGGSSVPLGLLHEQTAITNDITAGVRDFTNAAWVKTSMTCAKTATGWDGVASSGSTCTATGANGTVKQTIAVTGQHALSVLIKRRTGTCAVSVAPDGVTFTDITARLSSTIFKRVVPSETVGWMNGGSIVVRSFEGAFPANPVLTIKLACSGDAVDLDMAQSETGYFASTPFDGTRTSELHSFTVPAVTPKSMSLYLSVTGEATGSKYNIQSSGQKDVNNEMTMAIDTSYGPLAGSPFCFSVNAGVYQELYSTEISPTIGPVSVACSNDGTTLSTTVGGVTSSTAATVTPATAITTVWLGSRAGGAGRGTVLSRYCLDPNASGCKSTQNVAPRAVAWIGDSISAGSVSAPTMPPAELAQLIGRTVWNKGVPGDNVAGCHSRWSTRVRGRNYSTLVYGCGTNDMIASSVPIAHAAWTVSQTTLEQALSDGLRVVTFNILPEKKAAAWTTNMQAALDAYNADWAAWCATNASNPNLYCVNAYSAMGGGTGGACVGSDPACLLNAYDSGDGRHPNGVGSTALATLVSAGSP